MVLVFVMERPHGDNFPNVHDSNIHDVFIVIYVVSTDEAGQGRRIVGIAIVHVHHILGMDGVISSLENDVGKTNEEINVMDDMAVDNGGHIYEDVSIFVFEAHVRITINIPIILEDSLSHDGNIHV